MVSEMINQESQSTETATETNTTARNPRLESAGFFNTKIGVSK